MAADWQNRTDSTEKADRGWQAEGYIMRHEMFWRFFTIKTLIRAAFTALSLSSIGVAHSQPSPFHAPAHSDYHNN